MESSQIKITGTQISYYHICKRKLWLFSRNIQMEQNSDLVEKGKIIHETSYQRKKKEIQIEGIKIDFIEAKKGMIHEVKKSKSVKEAHIWQLKYYLYVFKQKGLSFKGYIDYPLIRKREKVELINNDCDYIVKLLNNIEAIVYSELIPEVIDTKICKKCSYYELCYI